MQAYVPGYRLKQKVQFERFGANRPLRIPEMDGEFTGLKVSVFLEVEGAAHYLPAYAGNLDIMTSAALRHRASRSPSACREGAGVSCRSDDDEALHPGRHPARRHARHPPPVQPRCRSRAIARALDEAGVDAIEVAHGDGLAGSSFNYGFGAHTDWDWIEAVAEVVEARASSPPCCCPASARSTICGAPTTSACARCASPPIAPRPTSPSSISSSPADLGMDVAGFLMMSHMIPPEALAEQAKLMESYGAHCVYVTDSGGATDDGRRSGALQAYDRVLKPETERGIHAHHNLSLGVANSIVGGAERRDPRRRIAGRHGRGRRQRAAGGVHRRGRPSTAGITAAICSR